jgi:transcriptional regulator with XRE-family HTH domain
MTQGQLADLTSVSVRTIRDLELGLTRNPRRETLRLLLDGLRLTGARRAKLEHAAGGSAPETRLADELVPPPAPLGPIIGRERDIEALTRLLESQSHRLIRVVGVAGVGKSRLLQEVASLTHIGGRMPVGWIDTSAGERARQQASSLHRQLAALLRGEDELDALADVFGGSDVLLALTDEMLSTDGENALRRLLERCPGLRVLCETRGYSRPGEATDYPLFPLGVGDGPVGLDAFTAVENPALTLMLLARDRLAPAARSDRAALDALAGICQSLDGLPQAIASAASWLLLYEPAELWDIARTHPFRLTVPPSDDVPSLRAALTASLNSLRPRDTEVLRRLARTRRPWTISQATVSSQDADTTLGAIHLLCSRGLVRPADHSPDGTPRFTVLNLVHHILAEGAPAARDAAIPPHQVPMELRYGV